MQWIDRPDWASAASWFIMYCSGERSRAEALIDVFQFEDRNMKGGTICVAPFDAVRSVFTARSFVNAFRGWCLYTDTATDKFYIGVHRKRMAARFRRLLREGGVTFNVQSGLPASFKMGAPGDPWSSKSSRI